MDHTVGPRDLFLILIDLSGYQAVPAGRKLMVRWKTDADSSRDAGWTLELRSASARCAAAPSPLVPQICGDATPSAALLKSVKDARCWTVRTHYSK